LSQTLHLEKFATAHRPSQMLST